MMNLKHFLLKNMILPIGDAVFGQRMMARLRFLEEAQYWSREKVLEWQSQDLQSLIRIVYAEVPFYHELFDQRGVKPNEIGEPADLHRLPIVTKEMLREGFPDRTTRSTGQKTYKASTSGSTGKNFVVMEDAYTAGWYRASFMLALTWSGWRIGEPQLQTGITPNRSLDRKLKDWLLGCHYFSAYQLDNQHLDAILDEMEKYDLKHLWGFPGSLYFLAKRASARGLNRPLKAVVTWGDSLYAHYRHDIEETFQTKVFDTYGCAEGIQIAAQCEEGSYHLHSLDAVVEFLDDDGNAVKPGEIGNIVVTRLHPGPMPLIRYAIGDLGVPSAEERCACGRGFPLMDSIRGRNADVIVTPTGNRLIVHFFTGVMEHFDEIDSFQVVQSSKDALILRIVPVERINETQLDRIRDALVRRGLTDMRLQFDIVDEIPLPITGKHRFVINEFEKPDGNDG